MQGSSPTSGTTTKQDAGHYLVVEVEDLTTPEQLDDASLFMDPIRSESAETIIYTMGD